MTWQALILDGLVVASVTVLAAMRIIPSEAALAVLCTIAGARAMVRNSGGPPPGTGAGGAAALAAGSTVGLLAISLFRMMGHRS